MLSSRRVLFVLCALVLLPGLAFTGPPEFLRGDVNDDGCVGLFDAVYMLDALVGMGPNPTCLEAADLNDDGLFNVADPIYLLGAIFAGGAPVPPPGPQNCGIDPTPDGLGCDSYTSCPPTGICSGGGDPDFTLSLSSGAGAVGEQEQISASFSNSEDVRGWSFGVCHDSTFLGDPVVVNGATTAAFNDGEGPDLDFREVIPGEGWTVGTIISTTDQESLPPGMDHELYLATYELLADTP